MGRTNGSRPTLTPDVSLAAYSWPGNVRELANPVERILVSGSGAQIGPDDLPVEIRAQHGISFRPKRERRRTIADDLYNRMMTRLFNMEAVTTSGF